MRMTIRRGGLRKPIAGDERCQHQLWNVLRERRHRGQNQRRRAAKKHGQRQRLVARFGARVVKSAALANLPVHAGRRAIVDLHPVHAEVVPRLLGMLRINQRKGDEGPAVLGPARQHRQAIEPDVRRDHFAHRAGGDPLRADLEQIRPMSRAPQSFAGVGGSSVSARCTRRLIKASGRVPNASSARRAVPNRFVTSGNRRPSRS